MSYHVKFGCFASKGIPINRRELQYWEVLGPHPYDWGMADPLELRLSLTLVTLPNLVILVQMVPA